jgi:hypothetical protein
MPGYLSAAVFVAGLRLISRHAKPLFLYASGWHERTAGTASDAGADQASQTLS